MKKKKLWIHIGVLAAVFVLAVIVSSIITNRGSDDLTVDMGTATLPRVKFLLGDNEVNTLVGYRDEMDITAMRDTITPINDDDTLTMVLEHHENSIDQIRFEVYSLDGEEIYKKGIIKEKNGGAEIPLDGALQGAEESVLKVILTVGDQEINYYTRIVTPEGLDASNCLAFAQKFHENTFDKGTVNELNSYLETNADGDNTTYQTVTIHSDSDHVTWGNLNPEINMEPEWDVKESNSTYTSVLARYQVVCTEGETRVKYNVREFFRIRSHQGEIYLLDYKRTMNQVFDGTAQVLGETGIDLGLAPLDIVYMTNDDGTIVSFVQERDLWTYNQAEDELSLVFSFSNTEGNDIRNWYDQHQIRILSVEENGSTTFAVYGYMNRGRHEGHVGVDIFYFDIEKNALEEKAFIPSNKSFVIAEDELGHMVYYSNDSEILYVLTGGALYRVNLSSNQQTKLAENLEDGQYVASEDGHLLAYQTNGSLNEATEINVIDLKTGEENTITCGEGECIRPLGFVFNDFVYGLARTSDKGQTISGEDIVPMYQLEIRDSENEVVKTYQAENVFVSDVIIESNMVTVNRMTKKDSIYIGTTQDYITNNEEKAESNISLKSYVTEEKETQMRLVFEEGISDKNPKILKPKQVILEDVITIAFDGDMKTQKYYVYGMGELAGVYDKAAYAIQKAESISGVVISSSQAYIWEKGNRELSYDTGVGAFRTENKTALEACREFMAQYDAEEVDLSGCTIEQVLYIINKGLPAIAILDENQAVLLTAYNSGTVTYINPTTGESSTVDYDTMNQQAANAGNTFIGYVR